MLQLLAVCDDTVHVNRSCSCNDELMACHGLQVSEGSNLRHGVTTKEGHEDNLVNLLSIDLFEGISEEQKYYFIILLAENVKTLGARLGERKS